MRESKAVVELPFCSFGKSGARRPRAAWSLIDKSKMHSFVPEAQDSHLIETV